ncbi:MAG: aminomethyltransferase family protein, partial [Geminicoccales bacterium]
MRNQVNLLPTPFTERLKSLNLNHSWERWEGYLSVGTFDNVVREYFAIRNAVSVYDISPMTRYRVTGAQAPTFMDRAMTRNMAKCKVGQAAYALWCNDDGKVVEDGTVFRLAERDYLINVQEHNLCWFQDTAWRMDVTIEDVSRDYAGLTIQGPLSRELLRQAGVPGIADLKFFRLAEVELDGMKLLVSRTGFTGDLGYEVALPPVHAEAFWDRLWRTQVASRLVPIGSQALNFARIEAGFLQVNADFIGAESTLRPSQRRSPFELGFDWLVDLDKPFFVGRRALLAEKESGGPKWRTVGLDIAGNKPAVDSFLYSGSKEVGRVTSADGSPICKRNVAIATVRAGYDTLG